MISMHDVRDTLDLDRIRADTPSVTHQTFLLSAGASLMPIPVVAAMHDYEAAGTRLIGAILLEHNDVYGPPPPCKVFRSTIDGPGTCGRVSGLVARQHAAGPDGIRGSTARQMDELKWLTSFNDLCRTRSDPVRHHLSLPSQASAALQQRRPGYAATGTTVGRRYVSARVSIAHRARAVLCATAVAATFTGRRPIKAVSHGRGATSLRNVVPTTARAPWIRRVRK